jgi:hypothetical protein
MIVQPPLLERTEPLQLQMFTSRPTVSMAGVGLLGQACEVALRGLVNGVLIGAEVAAASRPMFIFRCRIPGPE